MLSREILLIMYFLNFQYDVWHLDTCCTSRRSRRARIWRTASVSVCLKGKETTDWIWQRWLCRWVVITAFPPIPFGAVSADSGDLVTSTPSQKTSSTRQLSLPLNLSIGNHWFAAIILKVVLEIKCQANHRSCSYRLFSHEKKFRAEQLLINTLI